MKTISPDGVSLQGAKFIYAPGGQAGEYSPLAANPYLGCGHQCAYCYVPRVLRVPLSGHGATVAQARKVFDQGAKPRPNYLHNLRRDAENYQEAGLTGQVMLSFTTDPYHPGDTTLTRQVLQLIQEHGMGICTLTKGGTRALRDLDLFRPDRDAFATTMTSVDAEFSKKWERAAALPEDRMAALKAFHNAGIFTWVSLEPTLDAASSMAVVEATHEFVDLYKVGRVNYLPMTKTTDWEDYTHRMVVLLVSLGKGHYIKKDLQPYLPPGYPNPLRVSQHH